MQMFSPAIPQWMSIGWLKAFSTHTGTDRGERLMSEPGNINHHKKCHKKKEKLNLTKHIRRAGEASWHEEQFILR